MMVRGAMWMDNILPGRRNGRDPSPPGAPPKSLPPYQPPPPPPSYNHYHRFSSGGPPVYNPWLVRVKQLWRFVLY